MHSLGVKSSLLYSQMHEGWIIGVIGRRLKSRRCLGCNQLTFFCNTDRSPSMQFSLRTLLIATTLVAVGLGLIVYAVRS